MIVLLKSIYGVLSFKIRSFFLWFLAKIIRQLRPSLIIRYDSARIFDGFGAQLHRILSLNFTSYVLNLEMFTPKIAQVTLHPSDPFKDISALSDFLELANSYLFDQNRYASENMSSSLSFNVGSLSLHKIYYYAFLALFSRTCVVLWCTDAHKISDLNVDEYPDAIRRYYGDVIADSQSEAPNSEIVIHYRQGPGNFVIYPGQKIPRQLDMNLYVDTLHDILTKSDGRPARLIIFTDAPNVLTSFKPPAEQLKIWEGTPGFDGTVVEYKSFDFESLFLPIARKYNIEFILDRDANPLEMIIRMANAQYLLISRSSLSYVGGLFNQLGKVYFAPSFWHSKPSSWLVLRKNY